MKRLLLCVLCVVPMFGCGSGATAKSTGFGCSCLSGLTEYRVMRVRGCEYVVASGGNEGIAHAGDCDNPKHLVPFVVDNDGDIRLPKLSDPDTSYFYPMNFGQPR